MWYRKPFSNKLTGYFFFCILFIMAFVFYLERTTYVDPAFAIFNSILHKTFVPSANRLAAVIPQLLPLCGIWLHMPLKVIVILSSVSFVGLYFLVYLIIAYWLKNDLLALAVPLIAMLGISSSYFWITTETHQTLVYSVLLFAYLDYSKESKGWLNMIKKVMISLVIMLLCFYTHPVSVFTVLFVLGYFIVVNKQWTNPLVYIVALLIIAVSLFKTLTTPAIAYDSGFYKLFFNGFGKILNLGSSEGFLFFKHNLLTIYFFPLLLFLSTMIFYVLRKLYVNLLFYAGVTFLFALILFTTFRNWYYPFITEKDLMPLMLFIILPFLKEFEFRLPRMTVVKQIIIVAAFLTGCVYVVKASGFYHQRYNYIRYLTSQARKLPERKFTLDETIVDRNLLNGTWAIAPESMVISALQGPDSAISIYILTKKDSIANAINRNNPRFYLNIPMYPELMDVSWLDKRYFNLGKTPYGTLTEENISRLSPSKVLYTERFDKKGDTFEPGGNRYLLFKSEFGPGYHQKLTDIFRISTNVMNAIIRVLPMEETDPKSIELVIAHQKGKEMIEYYIGFPATTHPLKPHIWDTISVSGTIHQAGINDVVTVYLWNRSRKPVGLDDFIISFRENNSFRSSFLKNTPE
jgi:hypothetical protein